MLEQLDKYRGRARADDPFNEQTRHGFEAHERKVLGMLSKNVEVPKRLKEEWGHVAFGRVLSLRRNEERRDYATAFPNALVAGGYDHRPDPQTVAWISDVFATYDKIPSPQGRCRLGRRGASGCRLRAPR